MPDSALRRLADLSRPGPAGRWIIAALEGVQASAGTGRRDPGFFHPSALGDPCDAKLAFIFLGAPAVQVISARTQRIFDLGSGRDEYLKRDMAASGISVIRTEEERGIFIAHLRIRGDLDDLVKHPITGDIYVVDYKTMNPTEFEALKEVKPSHHIQVHPYMFAKSTRLGFVLYENKANQEFKLKKANFDDTIWRDKIENRIINILNGLEQNYVNRNPANCTYCPFNANGVCVNNDIPGLKRASGLYDSA